MAEPEDETSMQDTKSGGLAFMLVLLKKSKLAGETNSHRSLMNSTCLPFHTKPIKVTLEQL